MYVNLDKISAEPPKGFDEKAIKDKIEDLKKKLVDLQLMLYAQGKYSLLIVLQGMDASGKDGTVKHIFSGLNPLGCNVIPFKKPTPIEMNHDFLWRVHDKAPERGMIHIFNRSHYEDVLVPKVEGYITKADLKKRYEDIKNFETLLTNNGTVVLKFYLHITPDVQKARLKERLENRRKYRKHNDMDWDSRKKRDDYMDAYEDVFKYTNTRNAPWHIVPSNENRWKVYQILDTIVTTMKTKMRLRRPGLETEKFD